MQVTEHVSDEVHQGSGLSGTFRLIAIVTVLVLAVMAVLVVLDVIPTAALNEMLTKIGLLAVIGALASVAVWALMQLGRK